MSSVSSTTPSISSSSTPSTGLPTISHFLVFSSHLETVISFVPKHGWMLYEEKDFRLYISGHNLQNSSIVFSDSINECTPTDYISPVYALTSAPVIDVHVKLKDASTSHSSIYLCLLTPQNRSLFQSNSNDSVNATQFEGPYYTLLREKGRIPFAAKICLILMLFIVSGFFSGLNLGLMSLTVNDLRLIAESEDPSVRYYARRVLPLRKRGNYLLCSIVLANVLVNSLGTVLLDSLVHGLFAVIVSTIMIVLMGEIIPQAICSRYGLVIGAHTHVITWIFMILTGVISYPLGFILDKILGQEVTASYTRDQIAVMLTRISADLEKPELDVITGVLSLRKKTVKEAMTWLPDVYMLDKDRKTDAELLLDVHKHGYSRIPVYANEKSNVIGIVKLRDFALITPEQYHLTVKHLMEFHMHHYGYTKTTDSLYNLMQEFLKSRWHIALVQELRNEEDNVDPVFASVGVITLEDVLEEMLQREIIEEADFFTDNRSKVQRKRAKTMDYTALVKRPLKGPSISPQLKVAVFQFLSTNVHQFTSGFISQEILKILLNYNIYAMIKHQAGQSGSSIYLYKKGFRYELFTFVMQGNATLESGIEQIMSTVGPFSCFAAAALLAKNKTIRDVHQFLDRLCTVNSKSNHVLSLLDDITSIFIPDYNLIVNSELHVLQIHRLVWLAAVRATQRQRGNDPYYRRMPPEQLLSNALDEIASSANAHIDKNNLTNSQRIILNEKDLTQVTHGLGQRHIPTSASVFDVIHSLTSEETTNTNDTNQPETVISHGLLSLGAQESSAPSSIPVVCNPLLLSLPHHEQSMGDGSGPGYYRCSSSSTSLNERGFNSSMHINRMFGDVQEQTADDNPEQIDDDSIDQVRRAHHESNVWEHSTPTSPCHLQYVNSNTNLIINTSSSSLNDLPNTNKTHSVDAARRTRSMFAAGKCSPS